MRRRFLFASALATLTVTAPAAFAQTQIDDERTTPIATSTAGDIIISSTGRVTLTAPATAVTMDSDNDVTIDGDIDITSDDDGAVAVHLVGGNTGDLSIAGDISISSDTQPTDEGEDEGTGFSDLDGPTAIGGSRVGVLIDGTGAYVGDVYLAPGGSIIVEGNDSQALSVLTEMTGGFDFNGVVRAIGDRSHAINLAGDVSGDLVVNG
ncbi:MAG: autotransporter outer membrane beta-barrel domain-containing protein, partial [Maricaulis sp.]|nr:autotransporter outer membrane beta-barrel domain-containing protein [Maricaulis sp.]